MFKTQIKNGYDLMAYLNTKTGKQSFAVKIQNSEVNATIGEIKIDLDDIKSLQDAEIMRLTNKRPKDVNLLDKSLLGYLQSIRNARYISFNSVIDYQFIHPKDITNLIFYDIQVEKGEHNKTYYENNIEEMQSRSKFDLCMCGGYNVLNVSNVRPCINNRIATYIYLEPFLLRGGTKYRRRKYRKLMKLRKTKKNI